MLVVVRALADGQPINTRNSGNDVGRYQGEQRECGVGWGEVKGGVELVNSTIHNTSLVNTFLCLRPYTLHSFLCYPRLSHLASSLISVTPYLHNLFRSIIHYFKTFSFYKSIDFLVFIFIFPFPSLCPFFFVIVTFLSFSPLCQFFPVHFLPCPLSLTLPLCPFLILALSQSTLYSSFSSAPLSFLSSFSLLLHTLYTFVLSSSSPSLLPLSFFALSFSLLLPFPPIPYLFFSLFCFFLPLRPLLPPLPSPPLPPFHTYINS